RFHTRSNAHSEFYHESHTSAHNHSNVHVIESSFPFSRWQAVVFRQTADRESPDVL
ncbi:hypothetical protein EV356DRAFT_559861, partial [Viridothelium virens]